MRNWALLVAAFLPRRPAPGLLGDDVEVDRRRPRTLVEDFIKDARPYESALPAGVEPAAEGLQHFPETSFEQCPQMEAFTAKIRQVSTTLDKVYDAGGWKGYAQAHRASLVAMLAPKLRLPADVIPIVVDYWAHVGMSLPPAPPPPHGRLLDDGSELLWGEEWRSVEEFRAACYEDFLLFLNRY